MIQRLPEECCPEAKKRYLTTQDTAIAVAVVVFEITSKMIRHVTCMTLDWMDWMDINMVSLSFMGLGCLDSF